MSGNHDLESVAPEFLRQLHSDLVGFLRRHLVSVEALHAVSAHDSSRLVEALFGNVELFSRILHIAVDPGSEVLLLRFDFVGSVGNDIRKRLPVCIGEVNVSGLLRIADI